MGTKHPLSSLVSKGDAPPKHKWQKTERKIPGATLKLYACTECLPAHVKAYDMEVINTASFHGSFEYKERSIRK